MATSGLAETAGPTPRPEVHQGRQVPAQFGKKAARPGHRTAGNGMIGDGSRTNDLARQQQRSRQLRTRREDFRRRQGQRGLHRRRLPQQRVAVLDADTGKMKRYWGAYGNKPDDTDPGPYDPDAPPAQQFRKPGALRRTLQRPAALRLRSRQRPHPGVHGGRHVREGSFIAKRTLMPDRCGTSRSRRIRSSASSTWPTA